LSFEFIGAFFSLISVVYISENAALILAGTAVFPYGSVIFAITFIALGLLIPDRFQSPPIVCRPTTPGPFVAYQNSGNDCAFISALQYLMNCSERFFEHLSTAAPDDRLAYAIREEINWLQNNVRQGSYIIPYDRVRAIREKFAQKYPVDGLAGTGQVDASEIIDHILLDYNISDTFQINMYKHIDRLSRRQIPCPDGTNITDYDAVPDNDLIQLPGPTTNGLIKIPCNPDRSFNDLILREFQNDFHEIPPALFRDGDNLYEYPVATQDMRASEVPDELFLQIRRRNRRIEEVSPSLFNRLLGGESSRTVIDYDNQNPIDMPANLLLTLPQRFFEFPFNPPDPNNPEVNFEIDTFIIHLGDATSGHYISFKRITDREDGTHKWYKCDDHVISEVSNEEAEDACRYATMIHLRHI
jgi:hypothetical protein